MSDGSRSRRVRAVGLWVLAATITASIAAACANVTAPEGGPPDLDAPWVTKISPGNGAVGAKPKSVVIQFNEVISETPRGAPTLDQLVFISPKAGKPSVDWGRTKISISPKKGWKPNTVYSITVSPGISDLRNNGIDSTIRLVFSTGGEIPKTSITGVVFDWVAGKPSPKALVEAIGYDSTVYQVLTDSVGRYDLRYMPPGDYTIRAYGDRNSNRELDPSESWDTTRRTITASANAELYTFPHDTVGIRISEMAVQDSGRVIKLTLDKPYSPEQVFDRSRVTIKKSDSTELRVVKIETVPIRMLYDSLARKATADSIAKTVKVDTSAAARARADSVARKRRLDSLVLVERADREARRLAILRGNKPLPPRDTTPPPKMRRDPVYAELYVTLAEPLPAASIFRVQVQSIRSLSGTVRSPARTLTTPKAPVKKDSTTVKKDSATAAPRKPPA